MDFKFFFLKFGWIEFQSVCILGFLILFSCGLEDFFFLVTWIGYFLNLMVRVVWAMDAVFEV